MVLILRRVVINVVILSVLGAIFYGLYKLYIWVPDQLNELKCPSSGKETYW